MLNEALMFPLMVAHFPVSPQLAPSARTSTLAPIPRKLRGNLEEIGVAQCLCRESETGYRWVIISLERHASDEESYEYVS